MSKVTVWAGLGEVDQNEGRRGMYVKGYYRSATGAEDAVKKLGVFGTPGKTQQVEGFLFEEDGVEYFVPKRDAIPLR